MSVDDSPLPSDAAIRTVRLPDPFYLPRMDAASGQEVRDQLPWQGARDYVTDGARVGVLFPGGRVDWLGPLPSSAIIAPDAGVRAFLEDFRPVDVESLVSGLQAYTRLHPSLKSVWEDDLRAIATLLRETPEDHTSD